MTESAAPLGQWVGKKESLRGMATAWPVAALAATLDCPAPGQSLPPGWHWLYLLETTPQSGLGPDGLARRGGFLPPVALPRRMWAGGRLEFLDPITVGSPLRRDSEVISVEAKHGKSGELVFVTVRHTISCAGRIAVVEEHDIVYREAAKPGEPPPQGKPAPRDAPWRREVVAGPVMLFRFSALIFNANRIHYDIDFCRENGYPGLVVHGPLQTVLLLELCRQHEKRPVRRLEYRALHPVYHTGAFTVNGMPDAGGERAQLWTANAAGHYAMSATAYFQ